MSIRRLILFTFVFLFIYRSGFPQTVSYNPVRIMFYNVENAFDICDDEKTEDQEFLPEGMRRWNHTRYNKKISDIYKIIVSAGEWNPPEIVALCEVENRKVLEDLVFGTYLSKYNYRIIHADSPDRRGIDVCLIYRKDIIDISEFRFWEPETGEDFTSRSVLYSKIISHYDTIHLFVNHWPSRRGGIMSAEETRMNVARLVKLKADSINDSERGRAKILIMGDFNSTPGDYEIKVLTSTGFLNNLSERILEEFPGSYRYKGTWEMIDQVIASMSLINAENGYFTNEKCVKVFNAGFLLVKDPLYPGEMPYATYRGYKYQGGFSDHLPVITDLYFHLPVPQE